MNISVIIPTYNEAAHIQQLVFFLKKHGAPFIEEIIVSDCGSTDNTINLAIQSGASIILSPTKSRAIQMNLGARHSKGTILLFVHADTLPPPTFANDIINAIKNGYHAGCFSYKFNSNKKLLHLLSKCTKKNTIFTGGGDQMLFVRKSVFDCIGGFDEKLVLMEDFDIVKKLKKNYSFILIKNDGLVSARKYEHNSFFRVQLANALVFFLYKCGVASPILKALYYKILNQNVCK